jgi:hypothetical protein
MVLAAVLWIRQPAPSATTSATAPAAPAVASTSPAEPATAALDASYRIEAAFYRVEGDRDVRLGSGARLTPGDRLSLQVVSSVPTHVYVVNEDDRGESFLLFPLPGLRTSNPLPAGSRHVIPGLSGGERVYWTVSSAGGREHFLIFASPQPLSPAFQRLFEALPRPSADAAISPRQMSADMVGALRGVGGLAKGPAVADGPGLRTEFGVPLRDGEETVRGVWVRQLTLDNPGR